MTNDDIRHVFAEATDEQVAELMRVHAKDIERASQRDGDNGRDDLTQLQAALDHANATIKRLEAEEKTASGIILPGQAKEKPQMAEIVAVGPGTEDEKMEVKAGDTVIFSQYAGTEIKYQGEEYTILTQRDVLAIVE